MQKRVKEILEERQDQYGDADKNFSDIGIIWGTLLEIGAIPPEKVALLMDSLKTIRCFRNPNHKDSWLDKLGYVEHGLNIAIPDES